MSKNRKNKGRGIAPMDERDISEIVKPDVPYQVVEEAPIITDEMVDRIFAALEDPEMCAYLGITDYDG